VFCSCAVFLRVFWCFLAYASSEQTNNHNKEQAYKQTHKVENTKKTRRKTAQEQNTNGKHAECDHVEKGIEPKKQRSRILKYMKNPTHLKMTM
jgi:hypothetical protein